MNFGSSWLIRLISISLFPVNTFAEEVSRVNYYPGETKQELKDLELPLLATMPEFRGINSED